MQPSPYLPIVTSGLPRTGRTARIVVVGAGMAGLVAGRELRLAGHDVVLVEARARVGGRVQTLRDPFSPGLYAEAGAMRIPRSHDLTMAYVGRFGLRTRPFTASNPQAYAHLHGVRRRVAELDDPGVAPFLGLEAREHPVSRLWDDALRPFSQRVARDGEAAWADIARNHDHLSTREFLEGLGWSEGAIEHWGLLSMQEALLNASFLELLREEVGGYYRDLVAIEGGMDRLPLAFLPGLEDAIRYGARLVALTQSPERVTVHYQTAGGPGSVTGDFAILTLPFPALRHIEVSPAFSRPKLRAIRQLHYDASAKILMQFRRRFWEEDDGIEGGGTVTDLPIRAVYYPDHGRETGRGVLLASYTWSEDAQRWGSLQPRDRLVQALENLGVIHPQAPAEFETGTSVMWHDDEFAGGAFALFDPGQQTLLYPHIVATEGRIYFAGEHASLAHAWIQGAIESGLRAALAVHERAAQAGGQS